MITNGQARRIAADWQAPGNAMSSLQHCGIITHNTADEITANRTEVGRFSHNYDSPVTALQDLTALYEWVQRQGVGTVSDWGAWSDYPVTPDQIYRSA